LESRYSLGHWTLHSSRPGIPLWTIDSSNVEWVLFQLCGLLDYGIGSCTGHTLTSSYVEKGKPDKSVIRLGHWTLYLLYLGFQLCLSTSYVKCGLNQLRGRLDEAWDPVQAKPWISSIHKILAPASEAQTPRMIWTAYNLKGVRQNSSILLVHIIDRAKHHEWQCCSELHS